MGFEDEEVNNEPFNQKLEKIFTDLKSINKKSEQLDKKIIDNIKIVISDD